MISFTGITESIYHIRGTSKQKATYERILNFLSKKDQHIDLPAADLEEEINTLVIMGVLFKIDKNSLFIRNSTNTPTKDQENEFDGFNHNTDDGTIESENGSTWTVENINDNPKDTFSVLAERLDTLQIFFLSANSDIKAEIKNKCKLKTSKEIPTGKDEKIELLQSQIIYLRETRNSKNQLIDLILENAFKSDISKVSSYRNSNTLLTLYGYRQFPKRFSKNHHQKRSCNS